MRDDMKKIMNKIKRRNGEGFLKAIRNYDNGILDIPDIDNILYYAGEGREDAEKLLTYLTSLKNIKIEKCDKPHNPFELLREAGYNAFLADTEELKNSIKSYYASGEAICTFNDVYRHINYYIIHAVHDRAATLNRSDFKNPRREDDYGTSVISIQIAKRGGFISIKNRYNHSVTNCDNTFGSNPDNIIDGLSAALKAHFKVDFSSTKTPLPDNYTICGKQICKYDMECDGIFIGYDFYVKNGEIIEVKAGDGKYILEFYTYDDKTKTMGKIPSDNHPGGFHNDFNRDYGGKQSLHWSGKSLYDGDLEIIQCA